MILQVLVVLSLVMPLAACGNKGKLKTPAQMRVQEEKKARRAAKEENSLVKPDAEDTEVRPVGKGAPVPSPENTKTEADDETIPGKDMPVIITPSNDLAK